MAKYNTQDSIVDYLKSQGQDSSYSARAKMAADMGITNYSGSGTQNTQLLNALKNSSASSTITNADTKVDAKADNKVNNEPAKSPLLGVDEETYNKTQTEFEASQDVKDAQGKKDGALSNLEDLTNKKDIISNDVMNTINSDFVVPSAVTKADRWLANQLQVIQSGKTSYTDQLQSIMDDIMNREKFSYDVDTDPLFQQALASAMNSGKQAMQDTIGQASALTGGYGSTYATTAGNQAYNSFIEDAYDNLPQYYQMAMEAYQMEGDEMYRQYGMLSTEDEKEYNRNISAYDATYQYRNQVYNEAYGQFRDSKNDAFAMANLQLNEHGQRVNDAYNYYNAASNNADTLYQREYNSWADSINNAWKEVEALNSDAWANKNFDEGVRQYEQSFAEDVRQFDAQLAQNDKHHNDQMSYNWASLNQKKSSNTQKASTLSDTEIKGIQRTYNEAGGGQKGYEAVESYLRGLGITPSNEDIDSYISSASAEKGLPAYYQTWSISKDTKNWNNPFSSGNEDMNDVYTNLNGETMTYKELKKAVNNSKLSDEEKKDFLSSLRKQGTK